MHTTFFADVFKFKKSRSRKTGGDVKQMIHALQFILCVNCLRFNHFSCPFLFHTFSCCLLVWILSKLAINLMTRILARDHKYDERKDILITSVSTTAWYRGINLLNPTLGQPKARIVFAEAAVLHCFYIFQLILLIISKCSSPTLTIHHLNFQCCPDLSEDFTPLTADQGM